MFPEIFKDGLLGQIAWDFGSHKKKGELPLPTFFTYLSSICQSKALSATSEEFFAKIIVKICDSLNGRGLFVKIPFSKFYSVILLSKRV